MTTADIGMMFMDYLAANDFTESLVAFEIESKIKMHRCSDELSDLRSLTLTGEFREVLGILEDIKESLPEGDFDVLKREILLQEYLEMLASNDQSVNILQRTRAALANLKVLADPGLTKDLHAMLGMASVTEHPRFRKWMKLTGRLTLFERIAHSLQDIFGGCEKIIEEGNLDRLIEYFDREGAVEHMSAVESPSQIAHSQITQTRQSQQGAIRNSQIRNSNLEEIRTKPESNRQSYFEQSKFDEDNESQINQSQITQNRRSQTVLQESNVTASFNPSQMVEAEKTLGIKALPKATMISQISNMNVSAIDEYPQQADLPSRVKQSTRLSDIRRNERDIQPSQITSANQSKSKTYTPDQDGYQSSVSDVKKSQVSRTWKIEESDVSKKTFKHEFDDDYRKDDEEMQHSLTVSKSPVDIEKSKKAIDYAKSTAHFNHIESIKNSKIMPTLEEYQASQLMASNMRHSSACAFEDIIEIFTDSDSLPIRAAGFSPDGEYIAVGSNSKKLTIYSVEAIINGFATADTDVAERSKIFELENVQTGPIYSLDWAHNMEFLVMGSMDRTLKLFYTHVDDSGLSLTKHSLLEGHEGTIRTVCTTADPVPLIISAGQDSYVRIWDSSQARLQSQIKGFHSHIYCAKTLLDNTSIYTVGVDKFIQHLDIRAGKLVQKIDTTDFAPMNYISSKQSTTAVNFFDLMQKTKGSQKSMSNPQSMHELIIAHQDGTMTVWDNRQMAIPIDMIGIHTDDCRSVEYDPSCRYTASTSFDLTTKIFDTASSKVVASLEYHTDRVVLAKWHPFFPILLSTSADCQVKVFASRSFIDMY